MDDMYGGGSVLSYGKVPCTPISGAFANYYDVFGDVDQQRVGTGSSTTSCTSSGSGGDGEGDETLLEKDSVDILDVKHPKSFICKSCKRSETYQRKDDGDSLIAKTGMGVNDPYIVFIQDKQVELLGALHKEIRILKHENAELKFQIHVILQQHGSDSALMDDYENQWLNQEKATLTLKTKDNTKSKVLSPCGERERILELELESATKMIQELKWLQQHYENKIRTQETKMEDLVKQLSISTSECNQNIETLPLQLQSSPVYVSTKTMTRPERNLKSGRQRSSSVHNQHESLNRRNSLQSMLPDDYKEQVATLPPILSKKLGNISMSVRAPGSPFVPSSTIAKQYESMISKSNRRSSSLIRSPTTPSSSALPRNNNTPMPFCGDEPSHYND